MRIVSLLPSATEILCALGLRDQIVGVSHECDYPTSVDGLPRLTSSILQHGLDAAQIDAAVSDAAQSGTPIYAIDPTVLEELKPDLIVTQGVCDVCAVAEKTVDYSLLKLPAGERNIEVLSLTGVTFEGILRDIGHCGQVTGRTAQARELVLNMQARWSAIRALPSPSTAPRVLMLEWPEPAWSAGHWVPEMVEAAGGVDVFGAPGGVSQRKSWDEVVASDPDLIISIACGHGLEKNLEFARALADHPAAGNMRAVREGRVYAADANGFFSRPAPRVVRGLEILAHVFERPGAPSPGEGELARV